MEKRAYRYGLTLKGIADPKGEPLAGGPVELEVSNHDDLFKIIDLLRARDPFNDPDQATEFAIGLKLFTEVMLRNRKHPLFEEFQPAMHAFMLKLKGK